MCVAPPTIPVIDVPEPVVHHPNPFMNFIVHHYWDEDEDFVEWFRWELEHWCDDEPDIETTEFIRHVHYLGFMDGGSYDWENNPVPLGTSYQQVIDQGLIELDHQELPPRPPRADSVPVELLAESDDDE